MNVQVTDLLMKPDPRFARPASWERLTKVAESLEKNRHRGLCRGDPRRRARQGPRARSKGAEVFTSTSRTLEQLGIAAELDVPATTMPCGRKLLKMDRKHPTARDARTRRSPRLHSRERPRRDRRRRRHGGVDERQPARSLCLGSDHVVWVAGAQKIVKNLRGGLRADTNNTACRSRTNACAAPMASAARSARSSSSGARSCRAARR